MKRFLFIGLLALTACASQPTAAATEPAAPTVEPVFTQSPGVVIASAEVEPLHVAQLGFTIPAPVKDIPFKEGDAVKAGDAVLIATPGKVVVDLAASLGPSLTGKLVMDATNMAGAPGTSPGFDALKHAGGDVVKVFNCTGWENLADVRYGDQMADMFMAGGSDRAKGTVRELVKAVGFADAIDMGGDDKVPILEGFAMVWIDLAIFQKMGRGIAFKLLRR